MFRVKFINQAFILFCGWLVVTSAYGNVCGELENAYGPYDYTNPIDRRDKLPIVETRHFTSSVENLIKGNKGYIYGDLDYTLRAFPNHHRALSSMSQYQILHPRPPNATYYSIECYFDRAMRFKPDDAIVKMLFGIYYHRIKKYDNALKYYKLALELAPNSAEIHYNLGLLFFDMEKYDEALSHAQKAYSLGAQVGGLKAMLKKKHKWKEDK